MSSDPVSVLVDSFITRWVPEHRAHLCDTDDNDGERLRRGLRDLVDAEASTRTAPASQRELVRLRAEAREWEARAREAEALLGVERALVVRMITGLRDTLRAAT